MKWMFVTTRFPWPIEHGRWLRVWHISRALRAAGHEVALLSAAPSSEGLAAYDREGVEVLPAPGREEVSVGASRGVAAPYAYDERMARAVARFAPACDVAVLCGSRMLQYSPEASSAPAGVLADMVDDPVLEWRRSLWRLRAPGALARRLRDVWQQPRYERQWLEGVRSVFFVSQADAASFARRHPSAAVGVAANGVDADWFAPPAGGVGEGEDGVCRVLFTGCMSFPPNTAAAEFLARRVAPEIWRAAPGVRVQLVGADPPGRLAALADWRTEVPGRVADLRPYLWGADVVVLPMVTGTGIKNKLLEAWAAGRPVAATSLACQGVPAVDGGNLLIADGARALAGAVVRLLEDRALAERLGEAGRRVVGERFTWGQTAECFLEAVGACGGGGRACREGHDHAAS